ncbi:39S ribosomal protein L15, mitochondrial [Armadillidium nasatum]|uniref:Large ribosomal subunit protein uL15m n=1 Tax=Armadillidium nasatum TaxID=96803 RepID=A0A5N5SJT0_9CRUS|nr:39S ribosomal protein L15, mitochondrial [Armadillidium nasatum]
MSSSGTRRAFDLLSKLPRVALDNVKNNPDAKTKRRTKRKNHHNHKRGTGKRQRILPLGYEMGNFPFHLRFRSQNWNEDVRIKLSYCPLPLKMLQQLIDLGRIRTDIPVDACQLSQSGMLPELCPMEKEGGYLLQDEGIDVFKAEVNLEVQWATEPIIAAIERTGSKYGYELPDIKKSPKYNLLIQRKDPRQVFYGLQAGWVVSLKDKLILKPKDKDYRNF